MKKPRRYNQWSVRGVSDWQRFWEKVDVRMMTRDEMRALLSGDYNPRTACWEWTAGKIPEGYGVFRIGGTPRGAHRVAYELFHDMTIAPRMQIDHLCRNRGCVRPDHLEVVTPQVNQLRGYGLGGVNGRKTHCPHVPNVQERSPGRATGEVRG